LLAEQGGKSAGPEAEAAFQVMALELENGRFAWQWALTDWPESSPLLSQLLPHLSLFYLRRGRSLEAVAWLGRRLKVVAGAEPLAALLQHQLPNMKRRWGALFRRKSGCWPVCRRWKQPV
jgi:hypothetical protein